MAYKRREKSMHRNEHGITVPSDPSRLVWHGACGFWTDDWSKIGTHSLQIPHCKICGAVGMQIEYQTWHLQLKAYALNRPGYVEFIESIKETCLARTLKTTSIEQLYRNWAR